MKEKTYVKDIDESIYDFRFAEDEEDILGRGIGADLIDEISREKNDPEWMRNFRQKSLELFHKQRMPQWGPSIEGLDMDRIVTYIRPKAKMRNKWEDVPEDVKKTFERLGIPQAERESLSGVGAQYDSEIVYHNLRSEVEKQGVVYTDLETAMRNPRF